MGLNVYTNKGVDIVQMLPYFYCIIKKKQLLPKQITEIMVGERHKKKSVKQIANFLIGPKDVPSNAEIANHVYEV